MRSYRLIRPKFSNDTQKKVPINGQQDRRHIVPYNILRDAVQSWYNTHPNERTESAENLIKRLNDHAGNLVPGDRSYNRAIGSMGHNIKQKIQQSNRQGDNLQALINYMQKPHGFQSELQKQIMNPMVSVFENLGKENEEWGIAFAKDMQANMEFDYPFGESNFKGTYNDWANTFHAFESVNYNPEGWSKEDFEGLVNTFLRM